MLDVVHPEGQEFAEPPRDEPGQADAIAPVGRGAQKIIQVLPDDRIEHAGLGVAGLESALRMAHAPAQR